jgi:hypothetical protein
MVVDMETQIQLEEKLKRLFDFNTEEISKFTNSEKFTLKKEKDSYFAISGILTELIEQRDALNVTIKENEKFYQKRNREFFILIAIFIFLSWYFDWSNEIKMISAFISVIYYFYFTNQKMMKEQHNHMLRDIKHNAIVHYQFLSKSIINSHLEFESEHKKLIKDGYYDDIDDVDDSDKKSPERNYISEIYSASVTKAIVEKMSGKQMSYF